MLLCYGFNKEVYYHISSNAEPDGKEGSFPSAKNPTIFLTSYTVNKKKGGKKLSRIGHSETFSLVEITYFLIATTFKRKQTFREVSWPKFILSQMSLWLFYSFTPSILGKYIQQ